MINKPFPLHLVALSIKTHSKEGKEEEEERECEAEERKVKKKLTE